MYYAVGSAAEFRLVMCDMKWPTIPSRYSVVYRNVITKFGYRLNCFFPIYVFYCFPTASDIWAVSS